MKILSEMVSSRIHLITFDLLADLSKFVPTDLSVNLLRSRHKSSVRTYMISYSVKIIFFLTVASDLVVNSNWKFRMTPQTARFLSSCVASMLMSVSRMHKFKSV